MRDESQLNLLGDGNADSSRPEWVERLRAGVAKAAARGIYFGTSSWKYEGWLGQIYTRSRYETRGKFAQSRFERECLREYAEIFPHVCFDGAFYSFYSSEFWANLFAQVPPTFRFTLKVPEAITCPVWPSFNRYGGRAGKRNDDFLNAALLQEALLERLMPFREQVGMLVFEFPQSTVTAKDDWSGFLSSLGKFLGALPKTFRYGVEIRSKRLLGDEYFACLRQHDVAHVFNSWTRMPSIGEQLAFSDCFTADVGMARLLLKPGRSYDAAVKAFQPYDRIQEAYLEGRRDVAQLISRFAGAQSQAAVGQATTPKRKLFVAVNNRYEGSAPQSISAILLQMSLD